MIVEFLSLIRYFTIQKRQIKIEINNPGPKIGLEVKIQPIIFKTVVSIFFSNELVFFPILKTSIGHFEQLF